MQWLINALRDPLIELLQLAVLGLLGWLTAKVRARQRLAHEVLQREGLLPVPLANKPSLYDLSTLRASPTPEQVSLDLPEPGK